VSHDLPMVAGICDTLIVMKDGEIVESGPSREVIDSPKSAYTRRLIQAIRVMDGGGERL